MKILGILKKKTKQPKRFCTLFDKRYAKEWELTNTIKIQISQRNQLNNKRKKT